MSVVIGGTYRHVGTGELMRCEAASVPDGGDDYVHLVEPDKCGKPKAGFMRMWRGTWTDFHICREWELVEREKGK